MQYTLPGLPSDLMSSEQVGERRLKVDALGVNSLVPMAYDAIEISYNGDSISEVIYKAGSETVATLTLSYTGGLLTEVART